MLFMCCDFHNAVVFVDSLKSVCSLATKIASLPTDVLVKHYSVFRFLISLPSPSLMEIAWWFEVVTAGFRSPCIEEKISEA